MVTIPTLERVVFFSGELLTADDLTTLDSNNQALRWLHNATLHNSGIGYGLDVIGTRGATSVTVNPGYATDSEGRELILSTSMKVPIPAVPGAAGGGAATYYLVADYVDDADEPPEEQRSATACSPGGAVRLSNDPAIRWKTPSQLNAVDVVLCAASIQNCVLAADVSGAVRRSAAFATSPFVAAGTIAASDIKWTLWEESGTRVGFTAAVDTSAASFQSTPSYSVQVIGSRLLDSKDVIVDVVSIAKTSPTGFTLQVALPALHNDVNPSSLSAGDLLKLGWEIAWMGAEG
ncbi:MAG TPA: hypothetical protein VK456_11685 [Xanthobacteraceae bacterium]|nr:hypothetical protein [Xanthobacteraceae bacterium]